MPLTTEHSAHVRAKTGIDPKSIRRTEIKDGVSLLVGKVDGEENTTALTYRFDAKKFTPAEAKAWLKKNKIRILKFYPASDKDTAEQTAGGLDDEAELSTPAEQFAFVELAASGLVDGQPFDAMAAGTFIAMNGQKVTFSPAELGAYAKNTQAAIDSSRTEAGELVGLPIDMTNHDHIGGAGWIQGVVQVGRKLRFTPKWTDAGAALIKRGERRFFSPTVDTANKVILGGSLCNWPASRNQQGQMALRPIEMASPILTMQPQGLTPGDRRHVAGRPVQKIHKEGASNMGSENVKALAELIGNDDPEVLQSLIELQNKAVNTRVAELLEEEQRKVRVSEFAAKAIGGTPEAPIGLPATKEELVELFGLVPPEAQKKLEELLTKIVAKGLTKFSESGHEKKLVGTAELPGWAKPLLVDFIAEGGTVEKFFQANQAELGEQASYNLQEFVKKE